VDYKKAHFFKLGGVLLIRTSQSQLYNEISIVLL